MVREFDQSAIESAITDLKGDVLLLDLARGAFVESSVGAVALQHPSTTALLHACRRTEDAMKEVERAFYGPDAN